jgi:hypothetical protein
MADPQAAAAAQILLDAVSVLGDDPSEGADGLDGVRRAQLALHGLAVEVALVEGVLHVNLEPLLRAAVLTIRNHVDITARLLNEDKETVIARDREFWAVDGAP